MPVALLGKKLGMTRLYSDRTRQGAGGLEIQVVASEPVTVIQVGPCFVSQVKTAETDKYDAIQLAYEDVKARNSTMPVIGHDAKAGITPKRYHHEVRLEAGEAEGYELGQALTVDQFEDVKYVDVIGTSKGKGNAGPMKRWGFKGQLASHGTERKHRSPGSVGGNSSNLGTGKPKKGQHKAGRMGGERVTIRSLEVIGFDKEKNLMWVKGPVPGPKKGLLEIRPATRLYKRKVSKD